MSKAPIELPARGIVEIFGRRIPILDSGTVGEVIELEQLLATPPTSGLRQNLEALAILIRHRLGEKVTADDLLREPMGDLSEFEEAINTLLAPFTKAFLAATMRRRERMLVAASEAMTKLETRLTGEPSKPLS